MGVTEEITARVDDFIKLLVAKDFEALGKYYEENATLGYGDKLMKGRKAIQDFYASDPSGEVGKDYKDDSQTIDLGNGYVIRVGQMECTMGGKQIKFWYQTLFHKVDGKWLIAHDTAGMM